jgi:hypothetical protein
MKDSDPYIVRVLDLAALVQRKSHFLFGPRQTGKPRKGRA